MAPGFPAVAAPERRRRERPVAVSIKVGLAVRKLSRTCMIRIRMYLCTTIVLNPCRRAACRRVAAFIRSPSICRMRWPPAPTPASGAGLAHESATWTSGRFTEGQRRIFIGDDFDLDEAPGAEERLQIAQRSA